MLKGADVYAREIMDQVLESQTANKQERNEVKDQVKRKIVESWNQEKDQICNEIKDGVERLARINLNGVEMIKLDEARRVIDKRRALSNCLL
jgi:hypothetical protein